MSSTGLDTFERAQQRANEWLAGIAREFGTDDRRFAFRAMRAWLHVVHDRLTVPVAAKFAAQLPELIRGVYYEGWSPGGVPVKYDRDEFIDRFATAARIRAAEVPEVAATVAGGLRRHMSEGEVDEVLAELPRELRDLVGGGPAAAGEKHAHADWPRSGGPATGSGVAVQDRIERLERRLATLTDAVEVLARGQSDGRMVEHPDEMSREKSARLAADILLASRT